MKELSTDALAVVLVAVILFLFTLGIVGQADYEEELLQQDIYLSLIHI